MALGAFIVVTAWLIFWVVGKTFGLNVPAFDETVALAYLTPLLGLYFGRRSSNPDGSKKKSDDVAELEGGDIVEESVEESPEPSAQSETANETSDTDHQASVEENTSNTVSIAGVEVAVPPVDISEEKITVPEIPTKKNRPTKKKKTVVNDSNKQPG